MNQFSLPGEDVRDANVALARVKRAEMVKAFLVSGEYRGRFGGSPTGNQPGGPSEAPDLSPGSKRQKLEFGRRAGGWPNTGTSESFRITNAGGEVRTTLPPAFLLTIEDGLFGAAMC